MRRTHSHLRIRSLRPKPIFYGEGTNRTRLRKKAWCFMLIFPVIIAFYEFFYIPGQPPPQELSSSLSSQMVDSEEKRKALYAYSEEKRELSQQISRDDSTLAKRKHFAHVEQNIHKPSSVTSDRYVLNLIHAQNPEFRLELGSIFPTRSDVEGMYGQSVRIKRIHELGYGGTDRECPLHASFHLTFTGLPVSGVEYFHKILSMNMRFFRRLRNWKEGIEVIKSPPWGRHIFPSAFKQFKSGMSESYFAIVVVKDPYTWMRSMCGRTVHYDWLHDAAHCPNLVLNEVDRSHGWHKVFNESVPVTNHDPFSSHKSLVHLWNAYYREYLDLDTKSTTRWIVRYEDLLFRPLEVLKELIPCLLNNSGGDDNIDNIAPYVQIKVNSEYFKNSVLKYADPQERVKHFTKEDLAYAKKHLDPVLMKVFGYRHP